MNLRDKVFFRIAMVIGINFTGKESLNLRKHLQIRGIDIYF